MVDNNHAWNNSCGHFCEGAVAGRQFNPTILDVGFKPTNANTAIPISIWDNRFQCKDYN